MKQLFAVLIVGLSLAAAGPARAQASGRDTSHRGRQAVPADARPPKGMCRIWIDGVPAAQQPAATDCATAIKNRPSNGRVIFGDDYADTSKAKQGDKPELPPGVKGFTNVKRPPVIIRPRKPDA